MFTRPFGFTESELLLVFLLGRVIVSTKGAVANSEVAALDSRRLLSILLEKASSENNKIRWLFLSVCARDHPETI